MISGLELSGAEMWQIIGQLLFAIALLPLQKRKNEYKPVLVFIVGVFLVAFVTTLSFFLTNFNPTLTTYQFPTRFLCGYLFLCIFFKLSMVENFYCTGWAYIVEELVTSIIMPIGAVVFRDENNPWRETVSCTLFLMIYVALAIVFRKYLTELVQKEGKYQSNVQNMILFLLIIILHYVVTDFQFLFWIMGYEPDEMSNILSVYRVLVCIGVFSILYMVNDIEKKQMMEQELNYLKQIWHRHQTQYENSQSNIEIINRKCHDLKHQIAALRDMDYEERTKQIDELESSVRIYDAAVKTGNTVLDTVLTEKSLYCEKHQINMTCTADGRKLSFINMVDLYIMFGNALDNAIESVSKLVDVEKRVIQVSIYPENELLMIRIRNYCEENYSTENGLPNTSKQDKDYHGFGLKSIQYTADKYNGNLSVLSKDNFFLLQILIPIPQVEAF